MMKLFKVMGVILCLLIAAIAGTGSIGIAATISGTVIDQKTKEPVASANIVILRLLEDQVWGWVTDMNTGLTGKFLFKNLDEGTYTIEAGKISGWLQNYEKLTKSYYPEWYGNVPGGDKFSHKAKKIKLTANATKTVTVPLQATPASIGAMVENSQIPSDGSPLRIKLKVRNWTGARLNLARWGILSWQPRNGGAYVNYPLSAEEFTLEADETRIFSYEVPAPTDAESGEVQSCGSVTFQVSSASRPQWNIFSEARADFCKP